MAREALTCFVHDSLQVRSQPHVQRVLKARALPWSQLGRVGQGVWLGKTQPWSSRAAAPGTAASAVIPELPSLGGFSES